MKFIKVDIDGTGKKWRLAVLREQGTLFYFPEEDFEDFVENYEDCEQKPVPRPDVMSVVADEMAAAVGRIVDGELWAGRVWCRSCAHEWVACAPWGTATFECPECGRMDGTKRFNRAEEASGRIATALVDLLGLSGKQAVALMHEHILPMLSPGNILHEQFREAIKFLAVDDVKEVNHV